MLAQTRIPENRLQTRTWSAWAMSGAGNNIVDIDEDYTVWKRSLLRECSPQTIRRVYAPPYDDDGDSRVTDISLCGGCAGRCTYVPVSWTCY